MHKQHIVVPQLHGHLADRLEERQRLDVADGAADLHHRHIVAVGPGLDRVFDLIGDMWNDLHGTAEIVTATLLADHVFIDTAGGEIVALGHGGAHEALVVTQVEIGLRPVIGHEHLTVLERAHGTRIHIDVGVELEHGDGETAGLEDGRKGSGSDALTQRRNNTARNKDVLRHENVRILSKGKNIGALVH